LLYTNKICIGQGKNCLGTWAGLGGQPGK